MQSRLTIIMLSIIKFWLRRSYSWYSRLPWGISVVVAIRSQIYLLSWLIMLLHLRWRLEHLSQLNLMRKDPMAGMAVVVRTARLVKGSLAGPVVSTIAHHGSPVLYHMSLLTQIGWREDGNYGASRFGPNTGPTRRQAGQVRGGGPLGGRVIAENTELTRTRRHLSRRCRSPFFATFTGGKETCYSNRNAFANGHCTLIKI